MKIVTKSLWRPKVQFLKRNSVKSFFLQFESKYHIENMFTEIKLKQKILKKIILPYIFTFYHLPLKTKF